jgi:hypothetical protein
MCGHSRVRSEGDASAWEGNVGLDVGRLWLALVWCGEVAGHQVRGLCGGVVTYVRVWAALREGQMLVGKGACGRDGLKENPNRFHKMLERLVGVPEERLVGVPEEMTMGVKRLYQMMNYGWRRSLRPRQVLLRPC